MSARPAKPAPWHVYVIRCGDGTLYTGVATDVLRRVEEHRQGRGAKYLRGRAPLAVVRASSVGARGDALRIERRLKRLTRAAKQALIARAGRLERFIARELGGAREAP